MMTVIPIKEFVTLAKALPKCCIAQDPRNSSLLWILDPEYHQVGHIHMEIAEIVIYDSYEYADQVMESIGRSRFLDERKNFSTEKENPVKFTGDTPELTDYGKKLYNPQS